MLFPNLDAEMARYGVTDDDIANALQKEKRVIQNRWRGVTNITLDDAITIRDTFFPGFKLEYLFVKRK